MDRDRVPQVDVESNAAGRAPLEPAPPAGEQVREEPVLAVELPAVPESLALVRHVLAGVAEAVHVPERALDDLKVAVTEACTNVVLHAYEGVAERGPILVDIWHRASRLVVRVSDAGTGMAPRLERRSAGLGLGLRLMAMLTAEVRIVTRPEEGTAVWMTFDLP
jgi:anti-sigma regulatory factor (Ser/Thr protein kinase)